MMRARDFINQRDENGLVRFHLNNPHWTKLAVEQGVHPDLNKKSPHVRRFLKFPKTNFCPEPGCQVRSCEHNLRVYSYFVEIVDTYDAKKEFHSKSGLSRYTGSFLEHEIKIGDNFQSGQMKALLAGGFDMPTLYVLVQFFSAPANFWIPDTIIK